jgi:phosphoenolpyruvate---glycerone phosphotransferase subunit DhaL
MEQRAGAAQVPVAQVLEMIAATLRQERGRLNGLSSFGGDAKHGDRMARAFADAADAVAGIGTGDAGEELQLAGQVLSDPAYGRASRYFGQGLAQAAPHFTGQAGLSLADLGTFLTDLLDGVRANNPAQPGMGTMIDVLIPAVTAYTGAVQQGLTYNQAIQGLLGAAMSGARRTANMPQPYTRTQGGGTGPAGQIDVGAAFAQTVLTGLVKALLGDKVPPTPAGQNSDNFLLNLIQQGIDLGNIVAAPRQSEVESLLGATGRAGRYAQPLADTDPGYGKGTTVVEDTRRR